MFPGLESDSESLIRMSTCSYVHVYAFIYAIYACICVSMLYMPVYVCTIAVYLCIKVYGLPSAHV